MREEKILLVINDIMLLESAKKWKSHVISMQYFNDDVFSVPFVEKIQTRFEAYSLSTFSKTHLEEPLSGLKI